MPLSIDAIAKIIWERHYRAFYPPWHEAQTPQGVKTEMYRGTEVKMTPKDTTAALEYVRETARRIEEEIHRKMQQERKKP